MKSEITTVDGNQLFEGIARVADEQGRVAVSLNGTAKYLVTPILEPELVDVLDVPPLDKAMEVARKVMKRYDAAFKELAK